MPTVSILFIFIQKLKVVFARWKDYKISLFSVHRERNKGGAVQPAALADSLHAVPTRGERELPRLFRPVGRIHHPPS